MTTSTPTSVSPLKGVRCLLFDTFGTLTDWETSISKALKAKARNNSKAKSAGPAGASHLGIRIPIEILELDWLALTRDWRKGYMKRTREIAAGGQGPNNIDDLHLELLNELLDSPPYEAAGQLWSSQYERCKVVQLWHRIETWPDVKMGLSAIRKLEPSILTATLSNGNLRLLVDIARTNNLTFDAHFSGDMLQSYKPNSKMYLGAANLMGYSEEDIQRGKVAMVASHVNDLRAAASYGLKTIYIPRRTEDRGVEGGGAEVKSKRDGGEVDVVLRNGLEELANYLRQ
ncbi:uncharacterized protein JCM15063_005333 [Sporobolomyces koalae]|uniref:uncharacterized protein n=1 Tax=Sporobolomyces koalae TaxID=500713 RepID=UPI00316CE615